MQRLTNALADRYTIVRELGRGGMATVYLAEDLRNHRQVALKVLRPELAIELGSERFLREISTTANLHHPHILPLYDSGEADGFLFYVMPFITGESLRDRLSREKQLPIDETLQITCEVADALSHAHASGIIHRDIKPENILLDSGHAVVADFGIARAVGAAGTQRITRSGMSVGTPTYMSPEQAAGEQDLDGRSDLYALACVTYEMLAGQPPFTAPTVEALVRQHMVVDAPPITNVRRTVPVTVSSALQRALAKAPADRFKSVAKFAEALGHVERGAAQVSASGTPWLRHRGLWVVAASVIVVAGGAGALIKSGVLRPNRSGSGGAEPLRAIAVLPFTFLGDPAREVLADGFTLAVNDGLGRVAGLSVPLASRPFSIRGRDVQSAGRASGAGMVLTGSVQVMGGTLRVRAQLVQVEGDSVVWSLKPFDGDTAQVFAMQDSITAGIVAELIPRLAASTVATLKQRTRPRDMQAYELYVKARQATYGLTPAGLQRAVTLLEQALARDSTYADAWIALADAYSFFPDFSDLPTAEVASRYRRAVEKGIALDPLSGWAFSLRGYLRMVSDWNWEGAWSDMREAVRLSPASADARVNYAVFLDRAVGEPDSAVAQMREAVKLDPTNAFMFLNLGMRFLGAGMLDSAQTAFERTLAMDPTQPNARYMLAQVFARSGRLAEAERQITRMLGAVGEMPLALASAAKFYRLAGRPDLARKMLRRVEALARRQRVSMVDLATARFAAGDRSGALDAMEAAALDHDLNLVYLLSGNLEGLDGNPRYEALRTRVFGKINAPRSLVGRTPGK